MIAILKYLVRSSRYFFSLALVLCILPCLAATNLTQKQVDDIIANIDAQSRFKSDFKSVIYLQQTNREKGDLLYQGSVFRRDTDKRLVMLFEKPKSEAGKGYLIIDKNLFLYTPSTGDWTRVSEDHIAGTDTNMNDFDSTNFVTDYDAKFVAADTLGKFPVYKITLTAKPNKEVKVPRLETWVDQEHLHVLKVEEYAVSARLLRTTYRTKWAPIPDQNKETRYIAMETRVFDEVEKGNKTTIVIENVSLDALPAQVFTKAWMESKSR
jgi:outer membrane lipoprotein-sorting protein